MKYYSEELRKTFDTEEECVEAEKAEVTRKEEEAAKKAELAETKKARASEIEDLMKQRKELDKQITDKVNAFIKDYNYFHYSYSSPISSVWDIWDDWVDRFFN